jgi:hypothetical protein
MSITTPEYNLENPNILYFQGEDINSYLYAKTPDQRYFFFNAETKVWDEFTDNKAHKEVVEEILSSQKYSEISHNRIEENTNTYLLDI